MRYKKDIAAYGLLRKKQGETGYDDIICNNRLCKKRETDNWIAGIFI